jgi:simple sugar transport system ATP-binding protein/ribose transport system ATP-binding protein
MTVTDAEDHVVLNRISKSFLGTRAVNEVSLRIRRGSVHGLVGENGAGKSTLGKLVCGAIVPDSGEMYVSGRPVRLRSPREALAHGLALISQELSVLPHRSALENVFLGSTPTRAGFLLDNAAMRRRYDELVERTGFDVPARARVGELNLASQQKVEILRALARDAELLVMDEPTASLSREEAVSLLRVAADLARRGTTVVLVSHFLDDVLAATDTVTVLRDGRHVRTAPTREWGVPALVNAMLGRAADVTFPAKAPPPPDAPVILETQRLARGLAVVDASIQVRAGEIVGLAGLVGSGRSELARLVFGADRATSGSVVLGGQRLRLRSPKDAIRAGIVMLPESRKLQGLHLTRSLRDNVALPHLRALSRSGVIARRRETTRTLGALRRFGVDAGKVGQPAAALSGGNQQRVLFAKWLLEPARLLIIDEPTRGVDVGGKRAIYELIASLAASGLAVLLISSELEEVVGLAHRVLVMRSGRLCAELRGADVAQSVVLNAVFGRVDGESPA